MKKLSQILFLLFALTVNNLFAQDEKPPKFNITGYGGLGFGIMESDNEATYNLNSNFGEALFVYQIGGVLGVGTGVGFNELSGNGFNSSGSFYHERTLIKIPLVLRLRYPIAEKIELYVDGGFYAQNILNDEYTYQDNVTASLYEGWNTGFQVGFLFTYAINEKISLDLSYTSHTDLTKFETISNQLINDKQRIRDLNNIGIAIQWRL